MDVNKKYGGVIKNWSKVNNVIVGDDVIVGNIHEDPNERFEEGTFIHTSRVVDIDLENFKVETLNTIYDLGGVNYE